MPLCNIMGITCVNSSFYIAFAFLHRETESDYTWVLEQLHAAFPGSTRPGVIVTDRELALMNAMSSVFPAAKHILCKWHIENNIKAKCWPFFRDLPITAAGTPEEQWALFLNDWHAVVESLSVTEYNRQWATLKARYRLHACTLTYLEATWLRDFKERFVYA